LRTWVSKKAPTEHLKEKKESISRKKTLERKDGERKKSRLNQEEEGFRIRSQQIPKEEGRKREGRGANDVVIDGLDTRIHMEKTIQTSLSDTIKGEIGKECKRRLKRAGTNGFMDSSLLEERETRGWRGRRQ